MNIWTSRRIASTSRTNHRWVNYINRWRIGTRPKIDLLGRGWFELLLGYDIERKVVAKFRYKGGEYSVIERSELQLSRVDRTEQLQINKHWQIKIEMLMDWVRVQGRHQLENWRLHSFSRGEICKNINWRSLVPTHRYSIFNIHTSMWVVAWSKALMAQAASTLGCNKQETTIETRNKSYWLISPFTNQMPIHRLCIRRPLPFVLLLLL